jgi:hypothetical protein
MPNYININQSGSNKINLREKPEMENYGRALVRAVEIRGD